MWNTATGKHRGAMFPPWVNFYSRPHGRGDFDADAEYLDEDMDFTFEDFEMPETFSLLAGMQ